MPRLTIRIDLTGGAIGPGKIRLLEQIASTGSIRKAAAAMKMSYRRAWLLLKAVESCVGRPLVETATGGRRGGGAKLSRAGRAVIAAYRKAEAASAHAAKREIAALGRIGAKRSKPARD